MTLKAKKSNCGNHLVDTNPNHYNKYKIQPREFITENNIPYNEANIIKYICRWRDKGGIVDLHKVINYAQYLIDREEKK